MAIMIKRALWAAAAAASLPSAAQAETAFYRCIVEGGRYDLRLADGEWYERRPDKSAEWTAMGCGTSAAKAGGTIRIVCEKKGDSHVATTDETGWATLRSEALDVAALRYSSYETERAAGGRPRLSSVGDCALLTSEDAQPTDQWPLSKKIANGMPFILATSEGGLKLRPGEWRYPERHSYFLHFEGKYYPASSTWSMRAVGFDPHRANSYHSCAPVAPGDIAPPCGGIHQPGYTMDRAYRPEKHELVAFGYAYRFDEAGNVFLDGKRVAKIAVPDL